MLRRIAVPRVSWAAGPVVAPVTLGAFAFLFDMNAL